MLRKFLQGAVLVLVVGSMGFLGQDALARGGSALNGYPLWTVDSSCFQETLGAVQNTCTSRKGWVLTPHYDNAGNMTFQIAAAGVAGTARTVGCRAYSIDQNGNNFRVSGEIVTQLHTGATEILRPVVAAHGWGATYAICLMDQNTVVRNYHY